MQLGTQVPRESAVSMGDTGGWLPSLPKDLSLLRPCAVFLTMSPHFLEATEGLFLDVADSGRAVMLGGVRWNLSGGRGSSIPPQKLSGAV